MSTRTTFTRRTFLKRASATAGLAIAAPTVVPTSALGAKARAAASERITVGMIGVGRQAYIVNLQNVLKTFEVTYRFADGTPCYYENTRNEEFSGALGPCSAYVKFEGTEGWIYGAFGGPQELRFTAEPKSLLDSKIGPDEIRFPLKSDKQDFIDAVKTGGKTLVDEVVGHRTTSLCHLGHIAIHMDQKLKWDPDKECFIGNDAANEYLDKPIHAPPRAGHE